MNELILLKNVKLNQGSSLGYTKLNYHKSAEIKCLIRAKARISGFFRIWLNYHDYRNSASGVQLTLHSLQFVLRLQA